MTIISLTLWHLDIKWFSFSLKCGFIFSFEIFYMEIGRIFKRCLNARNQTQIQNNVVLCILTRGNAWTGMINENNIRAISDVLNRTTIRKREGSYLVIALLFIPCIVQFEEMALCIPIIRQVQLELISIHHTLYNLESWMFVLKLCLASLGCLWLRIGVALRLFWMFQLISALIWWVPVVSSNLRLSVERRRTCNSPCWLILIGRRGGECAVIVAG